MRGQLAWWSQWSRWQQWALWGRWTLAGLALAALGAGLGVYPMRGHWLAPVLLGYMALLCWRPALWLFLLPALLPVLDLTPVTGWFFLEEIDLLILATLACCAGRLQPGQFSQFSQPGQLGKPGQPGPPAHAGKPATALPAWAPLFGIGIGLATVACAIGLRRGLPPWPGLAALFDPEPNAFNNYLSPFNALRIAKAWLWTLLLLPLLRRTAGPSLQRLRSHFLPGMLAGLLLVSAAAIRERVVFPGLLNFSTDYRITAPFSAMHTGGAALDGYLALCAPLVALWLFRSWCWWQSLAGLALLSAALYAGLGTFSRGLYAAYAIALLIVVAGWWAARSYSTTPPLAGRMTAALACLLVLAAGQAFHNGYFVERRFATTGVDLEHRRQHWAAVLSIMNDDPATTALGMGLGTFPASWYWRNPAREIPPDYRYVDEAGNRFLRLSAGQYNAGYGELLRIWQTVQPLPGREYQIAVDVRNRAVAATAVAFLHLRVCARQLLYPILCITVPPRRLAFGTDWQRLGMSFNAGKLGSRAMPVRLELAVEGQGAVVDVDTVTLRLLPDDQEILRNGGFTQTNNYWFFSSDRHHLPWHIKNLPLNLYFEMGWPGLLAALSLAFGAGTQLLRRAIARREFAAAAWLAALAGFLVVGLFDSLIDVPRIALLVMLVLGAASLQPAQVLPSTRRPVIPGSSQRGKKYG